LCHFHDGNDVGEGVFCRLFRLKGLVEVHTKVRRSRESVGSVNGAKAGIVVDNKGQFSSGTAGVRKGLLFLLSETTTEGIVKESSLGLATLALSRNTETESEGAESVSLEIAFHHILVRLLQQGASCLGDSGTVREQNLDVGTGEETELIITQIVRSRSVRLKEQICEEIQFIRGHALGITIGTDNDFGIEIIKVRCTRHFLHFRNSQRTTHAGQRSLRIEFGQISIVLSIEFFGTNGTIISQGSRGFAIAIEGTLEEKTV
jgi:hypothetical protein